MFGLFGKRKNKCPVDEESRMKIDGGLSLLIDMFGEEYIIQKKILIPDVRDFPIKYNGEFQSAISTLRIVAQQMDINPDEVHLEIYKEGITEINSGELFSKRIFLSADEKFTPSGGLYWGKQKDGKYHIGLEEKKLTDPIDMVATLSHELSHVKLLGEARIEENDETLTDLATIIFGLGIFNANSSFRTKSGYGSWEISNSGYLSQMEWGHALAVYSDLRGEKKPEWINFLSPNIKSDFQKSMRYIIDFVAGLDEDTQEK